GNIQLQLIDVAGRVYNIGKSNLRRAGTTLDVDVSGLNLKTGVYILKINSATGKSESIKLLIQ
ncbi:MAG: T9SS type A sorting domain-containing protein, partial [Bacteroidota bacterium]|nr:T9SS type A sorting domain-containing protein [Bacteroidota bacterium]